MAITDRRTFTLALAHALSAAEHGLPVIPLSATKLPALRSPHRGDDRPRSCRGACGLPGHGVHDATTDPAAVRALFAAAPWATGYGIACGRAPHHLIGIDLDIDTTGRNDSAAALQQLALQHLFTIPPTVTVRTPSGGRHIWLSGPPEVAVPNSMRPPRTRHRHPWHGRLPGRPRLVHPPRHLPARPRHRQPPAAPCPGALLRLLTPPAPTHRHHSHPDDRGRGLIRFVLAADEGQRNTRLFWAACRAYEHGFGDTLADALTEAAARTGLPEHEARATIASAARLTTTRCEPPR